jgi:hypothetical protein
MVTPSGTLTTLYSFPQPEDGVKPLAALTQGRDGSFRGVGNTTGIGVVEVYNLQ